MILKKFNEICLKSEIQETKLHNRPPRKIPQYSQIAAPKPYVQIMNCTNCTSCNHMACFQTHAASVNYGCIHAHHPQATVGHFPGLSVPRSRVGHLPSLGPPQSYFGSYLHPYPDINITQRILWQTQAGSKIGSPVKDRKNLFS